jgi:hypothetical protein
MKERRGRRTRGEREKETERESRLDHRQPGPASVHCDVFAAGSPFLFPLRCAPSPSLATVPSSFSPFLPPSVPNLPPLVSLIAFLRFHLKLNSLHGSNSFRLAYPFSMLITSPPVALYTLSPSLHSLAQSATKFAWFIATTLKITAISWDSSCEAPN